MRPLRPRCVFYPATNGPSAHQRLHLRSGRRARPVPSNTKSLALETRDLFGGSRLFSPAVFVRLFCPSLYNMGRFWVKFPPPVSPMLQLPGSGGGGCEYGCCLTPSRLLGWIPPGLEGPRPLEIPGDQGTNAVEASAGDSTKVFDCTMVYSGYGGDIPGQGSAGGPPCIMVSFLSNI